MNASNNSDNVVPDDNDQDKEGSLLTMIREFNFLFNFVILTNV